MGIGHCVALFASLHLASAGCGPAARHEAPGGDAWWERETAMDARGHIDLRGKPWWPQAKALAPGQGLVLDSGGDGRPCMLVRKERQVGMNTGKPLDRTMIVWVLDDDGDMFPAGAPLGVHPLSEIKAREDRDSDCYVVDHDEDGLADRLVDYLDNDGDGVGDEMEIRYFVDGELRRAWFWEDRDHDGKMWSLRNYEYDFNCFASDPYGDNLLFMNKYDPVLGQWVPFSECPFAFYDLDGDGQSECAVRVSAAPVGFDAKADPDYANTFAKFDGPFRPEMRRMGVVNVRSSYDIDGGSGPDCPLHYDFGFTMAGEAPYEFRGMRRTNPLRRAPKTAVCIPWEDVRRVADTYPAQVTGFSWHEYGDDAVELGRVRAIDADYAPPHPEDDHRWEGVFWIWERRIIPNTGFPTQKWNIRREYRPTPSDRRELYWSAVDRRIHLKGATEGWLELGHIGGIDKLGEIRMFDTDGDGHFDRWEHYRRHDGVPWRVVTVRDERATPLPFEFGALQAFYTRALDEAIAADDRMITALENLSVGGATGPDPEIPTVPADLRTALKQARFPAERRYLLDLWREELYAVARARLGARAEELDYTRNDVRRKGAPSGYDEAASAKYQEFVTRVSRFEAAYGEGRDEEAGRLLEELRPDLR